MRDPSFGAGVGKGAVMIIPVKLAGMAFAGFDVFQGGTIDQKDVHPAVVVKIKHRNPAAHGLHDVAFFRASAGEMEIDAGGTGNVDKGYGICGSGLASGRVCGSPLMLRRGRRNQQTSHRNHRYKCRYVET